MKVTLTGGKEPVAEKAVWDLLAFLNASFMPVTELILDGETAITGYGKAWAESLKIPTVQRDKSKGAPRAVVSIAGDLDSQKLVDRAKEYGIPVYELTNV